MKYRIVYNNTEVISMVENDTSYTYTAENVITGDLDDISTILENKGINIKQINDFKNKKTEYEIPLNPLITYEMTTECSADRHLKRKVYWIGESHKIGDFFRTELLIIYFKNDNRTYEYDQKVFIQASINNCIKNPLNPSETVNEYEFFKNLICSGTPLPKVILMGIELSDYDGSLEAKMKYVPNRDKLLKNKNK